MNVSVAMATYNGEKYIEEQLTSILKQLDEGDEVVVSDDGSSDKTLEIVRRFDEGNKIRIIRNSGKGVINNFENAIRNAKNEIIILCDQDDVWADNKVQIIKDNFKDDKLILILSDASIVDENLAIVDESFFKYMNSRRGIIKNIIKNSYLGCCMAFRSSLKDIVLPFPETIPMHDVWIGVLAELNGRVRFIPQKLVLYRRHGKNATRLKRKSLVTTFVWRKNLLVQIIKRQLKIALGKR